LKSKRVSKKKKITKKKVTKKAGDYHVARRDVTERELTQPLNEDLRDAWSKLREFGATLGDQRIYASFNCIMFSRKICYFFVRPKKNWIEVWMFLPREVEGLKSMRSAKKTEKYCNMFKLVHADQVEEPLTDWLREAYEFTPAP
jgi:hypothetical protein